MLRFLFAFVAAILFAGFLLGPASIADMTARAMTSDATLANAASSHGDALPGDAGDQTGEHCFHKLAGGWLPPLMPPTRIEVAIGWIDVSEALRQTHLPPSHPPPVLSA